ncbi:MAG: phosphoribosylformylglycinamidine cyclo-ligase [Burkholderiales bacterium]|nr:phosphoribosylformylglycinamidine cyclo-ligase [Burkholderiales bacterium]
MTEPNGLTYRDAGVDIDAGDALVENIKPLARRTLREGVLAGIGGFGALFEVPRRYRNPVLVSGTDGVGTKLRLAFETGRHDTVGIDLVAMSVNDILVQGAEPLFFLDYFACGKLDVEVATAVVSGIARGCELAGCALIGGETAEMPGMYPQGEYDLAGFAVGVVEKDAIIDGRSIAPGDAVIGLASSGAHSNGYSLIRRILQRARADLSSDFHGRALGEVILAPTRIYVKPVLELLRTVPVKGIAHITGGGLLENLPRILRDELAAELVRASWQRPPLFDWLQQAGGVDETEMHRVFNCGIGMVLVVDPAQEAAALRTLAAAGESAWRIGSIRARRPGEAQTLLA